MSLMNSSVITSFCGPTCRALSSSSRPVRWAISGSYTRPTVRSGRGTPPPHPGRSGLPPLGAGPLEGPDVPGDESGERDERGDRGEGPQDGEMLAEESDQRRPAEKG